LLNVPIIPRRQLGRSGIEVSAIGVGCWGIGGEDFNLGLPMGWSGVADDGALLAGLEHAHQLGATLFDTADVYGHGRSERLVGRLVAQVPRHTVVLSSKVGYFAGTGVHGYEPKHMRHQLEQTLDNLRTDHLDIYFLHHLDFGTNDRYLGPAADTMRDMLAAGTIRAVGLRGPHRFATDRLATPAGARDDKTARFMRVFDAIRPTVLAVRDNLLTPNERSSEIVEFAQTHGCGVLVNKPLAQGLLTGTHDPLAPRSYGPGDHRRRKRWFTSDAIGIISEGLAELRQTAGTHRRDLIRIALASCLSRSEHAAALVGFTRPDQLEETLTCLDVEPSKTQLDTARAIMTTVRQRLDALGEVFLDERQRYPAQ
jgi:aryl-alcohol dehydrogenase-like predicted oxidoreductase